MSSTSEIQAIIDPQSRDLKTYINEQLDVRLKPINDEITSLKLELKQRVAEIDNLKSAIVEIKSVNEQLVSANKALEARLVSSEEFQDAVKESFKQLETKVEDRTNRQLRQTIVVKGLPEKQNETWTDTRNTLANYVSKSYNMEFKTAYGMFEASSQRRW